MKKWSFLIAILFFLILTPKVEAAKSGGGNKIPCGNTTFPNFSGSMGGCMYCDFKICGFDGYLKLKDEPTGKCKQAATCTLHSTCSSGLAKYRDNLCTSDKDCIIKCTKTGETNPHYKCNNETSKCETVFKCGVSNCAKNGACCGGATNPYYICSGSLLGSCERKSDKCGFSTCDYNENIKSNCLKYEYDFYGKPYCVSYVNSKCISYYCSTRQEWISRTVSKWVKVCATKLGIPPAGYFKDWSACQKTCTNNPPVTTTTTTKGTGAPSPTTSTTTSTTTTTKAPIITLGCRVRDLYWGKYSSANVLNNKYYTHSLFSKPDDYILDNPVLEYVASDCETCKLTIIPTAGKSTLEPIDFIEDTHNEGVFGNQIATSGIKPNFIFDRTRTGLDGLILYVKELGVGYYTITLDCEGSGFSDSKSIYFNVFPSIRWRETTPVIN